MRRRKRSGGGLRRRARRRCPALVVGVGFAVLGIGACSSGSTQRTESDYCAAVQANLAELNAPGISVPGDVSHAVTLYATMAKAAPLAVEKEWDILSLAYQTAATVVPGDPASMRKAADTIRSAQKSADAVADYTRRLCRVDLGNPSVPTTLLSGSTTTDPNASTTTVDPAAPPTPAADPAAATVDTTTVDTTTVDTTTVDTTTTVTAPTGSAGPP